MELLDGSYGPDFTKKTTNEQEKPQEEANKEKVGKLRPVTTWSDEMEEGQHAEQEGQTQYSIF
ncbi:hypothetical protein M378DRAFT_165476, partial [Amanita muscaria Koide BX008]